MASALAAACSVIALPAAFAQAFPSQPITMIVPWPPGGGSDIAMRLVADAASRRMGQPMVVVNRPGAGGTIGLKEMASSRPDGYTIAITPSSVLTIAHHFQNVRPDMLEKTDALVMAARPARARAGAGRAARSRPPPVQAPAARPPDRRPRRLRSWRPTRWRASSSPVARPG
jgi:hypothetical protein